MNDGIFPGSQVIQPARGMGIAKGHRREGRATGETDLVLRAPQIPVILVFHHPPTPPAINTILPELPKGVVV